VGLVLSDPITIDDFVKVDIRLGTVTRAEAFLEARTPAIKLWIGFGPDLGEKQSSAQLTEHYTPESLIGRRVLAVVNLPARRVAGFKSEVLVLGLSDAGGGIVLIEPGTDDPHAERPAASIPDGARLH